MRAATRCSASAAHRIAPVTHLLAATTSAATVAGCAAPSGRCCRAAVRARRVRREWMAHPLSWLRPAARGRAAQPRRLKRTTRRRSRSPRSVRHVPRRREPRCSERATAEYFARVSERRDVEPTAPSRRRPCARPQGGVLGRGDRAADAARPGVGPAARRRDRPDDKATFGGAFWSRHARSFAERWNGDGVDTELVDPDELRRSWLSEPARPNSSPLLQQAWLATEGRGSRPSEEG